jgi:hypothetical protein
MASFTAIDVAPGRSSVAGLKTRVTLRYTATLVATATTCYGYATLLHRRAIGGIKEPCPLKLRPAPL